MKDSPRSASSLAASAACCGDQPPADLTGPDLTGPDLSAPDLSAPDLSGLGEAAGTAAPCCGTTAEARQAGSCCGPGAKKEAVASGQGCCG
ncbi:hypothetical protein QLQ12_37035 [Actinoplanes sp. NEAU-A12]|uniref:Uncharacterized protein n=1 Tax=Actinoplanes sandaracinus TaxID=3045177 RepID=A0ABT6WX57_9ACTN|nr:hypothetical protein [Actinoplanes sandaracinus]MDI6104211.1 hypothetical protein [Actinoplanes sandaracinus]